MRLLLRFHWSEAMGFKIHGRILRGNQPELPPLHRQAINAARALGRIGKAAVTGKRIWLTPAAAEANRAICESNRCGWFRENGRRSRCAHPDCGCLTRLKGRL